jgi:hypothetical protein
VAKSDFLRFSCRVLFLMFGSRMDVDGYLNGIDCKIGNGGREDATIFSFAGQTNHNGPYLFG